VADPRIGNACDVNRLNCKGRSCSPSPRRSMPGEPWERALGRQLRSCAAPARPRAGGPDRGLSSLAASLGRRNHHRLDEAEIEDVSYCVQGVPANRFTLEETLEVSRKGLLQPDRIQIVARDRAAAELAARPRLADDLAELVRQG
jgi:hypothetical protein